jgi:hypothetical protein
MTIQQTFATIMQEPSATVRKFKLLKTFSTILPQDAKSLSADAIADLIRTHFDNRKLLGLDEPLDAEGEKLIADMLR